jgi:hypothetical protein
MNSIYDFLLQGISSHTGITDRSDFINYLRSIQDFVRRLRRSYQTHLVQVDYSDFHTQAAYLITYFPQYVEMTLYVLKEIDSSEAFKSFGKQSNIQGCFFGSGPFPESVGLGIYLSEKFPDCKSLKLMSCDIMADLWEPSRKIAIQQVLPHFFNGEISACSKNFNMLSNDSLHMIGDYLQNCNLVVFQNCLNELDGCLDTFIANVDYILSEMLPNSILVLADLGQYSSVRELMQRVRENINQLDRAEIILDCERRFRSVITLPNLISDFVLTGDDGLIPRKNIYTRYLVARVNSP